MGYLIVIIIVIIIIIIIITIIIIIKIIIKHPIILASNRQAKIHPYAQEAKQA
jgi:hypothetical protein